MKRMNNIFKRIVYILIFQVLVIIPVYSLDLDSTINDKSRTNYSKQTQTVQQSSGLDVNNKTVQTDVKTSETAESKINQDLPTVPKLPSKVSSSTVAPINTQYSGKMPREDAFIPCTDIKIGSLNVTDKLYAASNKQQKSKTTSDKTNQNYRTAILPKGTQLRVINQNKITDYLTEGQGVVFLSLQELKTPYFTIPKNTKFTARVQDSHRPQMTCNGGLVGLKFVSAQINGYNQTIDGGIIKINTDNIMFSNLKGEHTYIKTVSKKAKWGQNKFKQYSQTSHKLANDGAKVLIAPFPYLGGCVLAAASTVSSPLTALLGKGGGVNIPAKTTFTMKLYSDAKIRY